MIPLVEPGRIYESLVGPGRLYGSLVEPGHRPRSFLSPGELKSTDIGGDRSASGSRSFPYRLSGDVMGN